LLWKQPQVLGVDLNRSELDEHDRLAPMRASIGAGGRVGKLEGSNLRGAAAPQKSNSTVFSRLGGDLGQKTADSARFWRRNNFLFVATLSHRKRKAFWRREAKKT
jgi:hypothetical protein